MLFDEYGKRDNPAILMLHGAFFVDSFVKQYSLAERYHLVVPHIKGFGRAAGETFATNEAIAELAALAREIAPVYLVGFSLGAQIGFKLLAEHPELFKKAILVSPWLVNKECIPEKMLQGNLKLLSRLRNKLICRMIGRASGMPKEKVTELVDSMERVTPQTVQNCVDNGISFETAQDFALCPVPVLAIAGGREPEDIRGSVERLATVNENCVAEIWPRARHNIPTAFARRFNQTIERCFAAG